MSEKESWSSKLPQGYQDILKSIDDFFQQTHERLVDHPLFSQTIPIRVSNQRSQVLIEAELPGVDRKQISLDVYNQGIHIKVREQEELLIQEDKTRTEERHQSIRIRERFIPLGFHLSKSNVNAHYKNGLLSIQIPITHQRIDIQ
ncbi:Hsp20/alpha crystallin family protein [Alkalihalophilus sp. As8PL]|uniref:Hsp20/alpha crystallin family protein n=1 Tax=Alkalihalophilus sp. As8PL TaxID=3237103 RepID=A0AB39BSR5_9BACI